MIRVIDEVIRKNLQVSLNKDFIRIFMTIMDSVYSRFWKKSKNMTPEEHLRNLNERCVDEAIKYVSANVGHFPKIDTGLIRNDEQQLNLFKGTDSLLNQMQYDRGGGGQQLNFQQPQQSNGQLGFQLPQQSNGQQINFQMPMQPAEQLTPDQLMMIALEQRKKDFPSMNYPKGSQPTNGPNGGFNGAVGATVGGGSCGNLLMNTILQTNVAIQNPSIVPHLINEIMQMQHLVDLMNSNPNEFQHQISDPNFLQMIMTQIRNKNDPKMKPMNLNSTPSPNLGDPTLLPQTGETGSVNSDYAKMISMYKGDGDVNQLNFHIPPSDQLVNNTLPDLDQIHLIDYDLSLDFRTDLETNSTTSKYPLKFTKYGNISKIELTSCLIPETDVLINEPYIYVKIEELGGRCFTSNHDNTFGKLVLSDRQNGYLRYVPDRGSCVQYFSQPSTFQKFTVSFLNYSGKYINLKEISVSKQLKMKKDNKIKFVTQYKHKLSQGETIDLHIYHKSEIESYEIQVESIIDENTFIVDNVFEKLSEKMVILRHDVNCSFIFRLSEINWNLLTKRNIQNAQLIRLSQLVNERRQEVLTSDNGDIIRHAQTQPQPQSQKPIILQQQGMMMQQQPQQGMMVQQQPQQVMMQPPQQVMMMQPHQQGMMQPHQQGMMQPPQQGMI